MRYQGSSWAGSIKLVYLLLKILPCLWGLLRGSTFKVEEAVCELAQIGLEETLVRSLRIMTLQEAYPDLIENGRVLLKTQCLLETSGC
jgi:hypothetical protein